MLDAFWSCIMFDYTAELTGIGYRSEYKWKLIRDSLKLRLESQDTDIEALMPASVHAIDWLIDWLIESVFKKYYMMNTVNNFLFKNFIALWHYLAKTQLLSFIHNVQIDLSIIQ